MLKRPRLSTVMTTLGSVLMGLIISVAVPLSSAHALDVGGPSDCDDNAMIHCGVHTTAGIQGVYNAPGSDKLRVVYGNFGISGNDINNLDSTAMVGAVGKGGDVYISCQQTPG